MILSDNRSSYEISLQAYKNNLLMGRTTFQIFSRIASEISYLISELESIVNEIDENKNKNMDFYNIALNDIKVFSDIINNIKNLYSIVKILFVKSSYVRSHNDDYDTNTELSNTVLEELKKELTTDQIDFIYNFDILLNDEIKSMLRLE